MTVSDIIAYFETVAPRALAEEWDNPGLAVGDEAAPVQTVLVCLDVTADAVAEAQKNNASLIVSHHPVIFHPLSALTPADVPYLLAQAGIAAFAAHTNLDKAAGGVNDLLAEALGLRDVRTACDGFVRIGELPSARSPREFAGGVSADLSAAVRFKAGTRPVRTVGVCSGAGGEFAAQLGASADAFVTGEIKHHEWLASPSLTLVDAGHYATEVLMVNSIAARLKEAFPALSVIPYRAGSPYETFCE